MDNYTIMNKLKNIMSFLNKTTSDIIIAIPREDVVTVAPAEENPAEDAVTPTPVEEKPAEKFRIDL